MIKLLLSPIIAWFIAESLKILLKYKKNKVFDIKQIFKSGGMPSAHSAVVSALTLSVFLEQGITSLFVITLVLSLIVIRDTMIRTKETRHKPKEVIAGIILGLLTAYIIFLI